MSMYYNSPEVVRALVCARISDARGRCVDGFVFEQPPRGPGVVSRLRALLLNRPSSLECC